MKKIATKNTALTRVLAFSLALALTFMTCFTTISAVTTQPENADDTSASSGTAGTVTPADAESGATVLHTATNCAVTAEAPYIYEGTATVDGTLHVVTGPDKASGFVVDIYNPDGTEKVMGAAQIQGDKWGFKSDYELSAGDRFVVKAYAYSGYSHVDGVVDLTVSFIGGSTGVAVSEYAYSDVYTNDTPLTVGTHTVALKANADNTLFVFTPDEIGVYTFTVSDNDTIGYWGAGTHYIVNPNSNACLITVEIKAVGQSAVIGIASENESSSLTVEKTGESSGIQTSHYENYVNKHTPVAGIYPVSGIQQLYVNIFESHSAILGADGLYHLDSADGPILYVDLNTGDTGFELQNAYGSYGATSMKGQYNGVWYDFKEAMKSYNEATKNCGGVYYLTEDIIAFFKAYGTHQCWYDPSLSPFTNIIAGKDPAAINLDTAWMLTCFVAAGDSANNSFVGKITSAATSTYQHTLGCPVWYTIPNTAGQTITVTADVAGLSVTYNGIKYTTDTTTFSITNAVANAVIGIDCDGYAEVTFAAASGEAHTHEVSEANKVAATDATHTTAGNIEYYICTGCSAILNASAEEITGSVIIPAAGHTNATKVDAVAPTCTVDGSIEYYSCTECGKNYRGTSANSQELSDADIVVKASHTYGTPVIVPSTCNVMGTETVPCSVCGEALSVTNLPFADHTLGTKTVDSTCAVKGYVSTYCTVCDATTSKEMLPLADHNYVNDVCDVCGDIKHEHVWVAGTTVAPTCTTGGYTPYTCSTCNETENRDIVAATGHTAGTPIVVNSTCSVNGYSTTKCTVCDVTISSTQLPLAAHTAGTPVIIESTCTTSGTQTTSCTVCEDVIETNTLAKKAHSYVSGACSVCGVAEPSAPSDAFTKLTTGVSDLKNGDEIYLIYTLYGSIYSMAITSNSAGTKWAGTYLTISDNDTVDLESTNISKAQSFIIEREATWATGVFALKFTNGDVAGKYLSHNAWIAGADTVEDATKWIFTEASDGTVTLKVQNDETKAIKMFGAGYLEVGTTSPVAFTVYVKPAPESEAHDHILTEMTKVDSVVATHTTNGNIEYYICDKCDAILDSDGVEVTSEETIILAMGHTYAIGYQRTEPTCTTDGNVKYYYCETCKKNYEGRAPEAAELSDEEIIIPAIGHTTTKVDAVAATHTTNGNIEYYTCSVCDVITDAYGEEITLEETIIIAGGHVRAIKTEAVAPTCTADGNIAYYYCETCKKYYEGRASEAAEYTADEIVIPATGHAFDNGTCTVCGETACVHNADTLDEMNFVDYVNPTCTTNGNIVYFTCDKCDVILDEYGEEITMEQTVLTAMGHTRATHYLAVDPTCTEDGNIDYWYCSTCRKFVTGRAPEADIITTDVVIPATGHTYSAGVCTVCGEEDPDYVPTTEYTLTSASELHVGSEIIIVYNATTYMGTTIKALSSTVSGTNLAGVAITINGTKLENIDETTMILVLEDGGDGSFLLKNKTTGKYLSHNNWTTGVDDASNATMWVVAAGTDGKVTFTVKDGTTGIAIIGQGNFKIGTPTALFVYKSQAEGTVACTHDMQLINTVPATCTDKGYNEYGCTKCEYTEREEILALGHTVINGTAIAPTCTEEGYTPQTCAVCDYFHKINEKDALGHSMVAGEVVPSTCYADGYTVYTCSTCGEVENKDYVISAGHNFESGACTVCGLAEAIANFTSMTTGRKFGFIYADETTVSEVQLRFFTTIDADLYNALVEMGAIFGIEATCTNLTSGASVTNELFNAAYQPVMQADGDYNFALVLAKLHNYCQFSLEARVFVEVDGVRYYMQSTNSHSIATEVTTLGQGNQYTDAEKAALNALVNG